MMDYARRDYCGCSGSTRHGRRCTADAVTWMPRRRTSDGSRNSARGWRTAGRYLATGLLLLIAARLILDGALFGGVILALCAGALWDRGQ